MSNQPTQKKQTAATSAPKRKKRRWILAFVLLVPLILLISGGIIAMNGGATRFVIPIIERETGLEITQGSVVLTPSTEIELRDAILRAPNIDGQGGEIISLDRAVISMNWGSIFQGSKAISNVQLDGPRLRVSIDSETGIVNLESMKFQQSGGGGAATPAISITNGIIEVGEHQDGDYTLLKELAVTGSLQKPDASGDADFSLLATSRLPGISSDVPRSRGDLKITGTIGKDGIEGQMTGLRLEDWPAEIVPKRNREFYSSLALTGNLAPTRFALPNNGKPRVILTLEGVDVSMPFIPLGNFDGPERFLRMRSTKGTIQFSSDGMLADLEGDIDNLLYEVELDYRGYSQTSAFVGDLKTEFRIEEGFRPLLFLPDRVTKKLDRFVGLKADIAANVHLERDQAPSGDDASGAPILVSGSAEISDGSARYEDFLYPFENIAGVISFTPDGVSFKNITGTGPTGATLHAAGEFDGLGEDSVVKIVIQVDQLAIDEHLLGAMDKDQRELVDTLFSIKQYENLLDSGYLLESSRRDSLIKERDALVKTISQLPSDAPEAERAALSSELSNINSTLRVPEFDFGGLIEVGVTLQRHPERPENDRWTTDIDAKIPNAGIVPKQFPLPIVARDVNIKISDGSVYLTGGKYIGLSGGSATVDASFEPREGFTDPQPYVSIKARQIPIGDRLIAAIPGYYDQQPEDPSEITLRRILDRLRMQGVVEADATIKPGPDGRITYTVEAGIIEGSAHPLSMGLQLYENQNLASDANLGLDTVQLKDMSGTIFVTESIIIVYLDGMMESPSQPIPPTPIDLTTQLTLPNKPRVGNLKRTNGLLPNEVGPPVSGPQIYTRVVASGLDLQMPLEHAIAVLSPSFADRVVGWRSQFTPDGVLDLKAELNGRVGASLDTELQIDQIREIGFSIEDYRYNLGDSVGSVELGVGLKPYLRSRGFSVPIGIDDEPMGEVAIEGSMRLTRGGQLLELNNEPSLRLSMDRGQLGSPGVRAIVDRMGSSGTSSTRRFFERYGLEGEFDLLIDLTPIDGARISSAESGIIGIPPVEVDGSMIPKTLHIERDGHELSFWNDPELVEVPGSEPIQANQLTGSIRFDGLDGYFNNIVARNKDYELSVDGQWAVNPGDGADIDVQITASGDVLNGPVRAILPDTLNSVVDQLEVSSSQNTDLTNLHIDADRLGTRSPSFNIEGSADMLDVQAVVGVPITELDGRVDFVVSSKAFDDPTQEPILDYQLNLYASLLRAGLLRVHNAHASILNDPNEPGVVFVPELRAGMHGGMVSGNAQIRPGDGDQLWYTTEIRTSGVRAAPIFDDLFLPVEGLEGPPRPNSSSVRSAWNVDTDVSRGIMLADLAMTGPIGKPNERQGRGFVRVSGGSIVALPGLINLIEASNLTLPTGSRLNLAEAEMYIDGQTIAFERLSASSSAIEILGYGTMDWTSRDIDLRFRSRSINPVPFLSDIVEGIRDELITIRVTGAPGSIAYSPEQFGTTRRFLDSLFGTPETEQQRRLREVESRERYGSGLLRNNQDERVIRPTREPNRTSEPTE
ncbi:MAG: hypothetical protein JJ974_01240 [Phycisphaerales bacterium]|nr:hypothetical protein [Phycisphaerales bacterium]